MPIDETRIHCTSGRVHQLLRRIPVQDLPLRPQLHDAPIAHRHRLENGAIGIHAMDPRIVDDQVGLLGLVAAAKQDGE